MKILNRGQIEVSFHWIFILIAGAAILAFFLIITKSEKKDADEQLMTSIGGRLDALLSAVQQNPDSAQLQDAINVELIFRCEADGHTYALKDGTRRFSLYSQILFSPEIVGGSKIVTWTKLYSSPYPTTQILYLTDENTQYIFLDSTKKYYTMMPEIFEKNLTTISELNLVEDKGFRKYIIVASKNDNLIDLKNSIKRKADIVKIDENARKIEFIKPLVSPNSGVKRPYVNDEVLLGAITSGNLELYGCTMEKLMQVSRITAEININRTESFKFPPNSKCIYFYEVGVTQEYLQNILGNATYNNTDQQSYIYLNDAINSLDNLNGEMARANCPTIY
jgi:hypothetical protein